MIPVAVPAAIGENRCYVSKRVENSFHFSPPQPIFAQGEVEIVQVYYNDESKPTEACSMMDSIAEALCFTAETDGHLLIAKAAREAARTEYERVVDNQQTAVLGSEVSGDIFEIRVGSLPLNPEP